MPLEHIKNKGPGSERLIDGDSELGFFGTVEPSLLIFGNELSKIFDLKEGFNINGDSPWLKFIRKGKVLFVAKRPFKHSISWDDLDSKSLVYGNRLIYIKGNYYRVRLLEGTRYNPSFWDNEAENPYYDPPSTHNSEWNELMYPVHEDTPNSQHIENHSPPEFVYEKDNESNFNPDVQTLVYTRAEITDGETQYLRNYLSEQQLYDYLASIWKPYSDEDLNVANYYGRNSWCQETWAYNKDYRIQRGCNSIDYTTVRKSWERNDSYGWRPVLELIDEEEALAIINT